MSTFKHRPNKIKHLSVVTTLDELHKENMSKFSSNSEKLEYISKTGDLLIKYYDLVAGSYYNSDSTGEIDDNTNLNSVTQQNDNDNDNDNDSANSNENDNEKNTEDEVNIDTEISVTTTDISQELKKLNELSKKGRKAKKQIKKRRTDLGARNCKTILQYFPSADDDDNKIVDETDKLEDSDDLQQFEQNINRASLQDIYLSLLDKDYACTKSKKTKLAHCSQCNKEKILVPAEGCLICNDCGEREPIIMENETSGHKDTVNDKQKYPYKKINHLREKMNQFQSKESANVPDFIYDIIYKALKKRRIQKENCTSPEIKKILKENRLTEYYEHLPQIYCKVTGKPPMTFSRDTEEKIANMFQSMQQSFHRHCPRTRSNFLSYAYVLNKLLKLLGMEKESKYFNLLKSKDKLRDQDAIWMKICKDMNWKYHTSV
jgi:Poxvirus Late Transcription Factor VLTF3 like